MKRALRPRAVVFDLDGTLLDSLPLVLSAIAHAVEPFGGRPTKEIFANLGGPPERFLRDLVSDLTHVPTAMQRLEAFHRENAHLIQPYAGAETVLTELRRLGVPVALWTGRERASAQWLLKRHRLDAHFTTVVCGDDLPTHKPDPEGLREILTRMGVTPDEALLVGDSDVDVLGGASCGVETLLIRHDRPIGHLIGAQCWHSVASPAEAFDVVRKCVQKISELSSGRN